jgi:hypothetical protein
MSLTAFKVEVFNRIKIILWSWELDFCGPEDMSYVIIDIWNICHLGHMTRMTYDKIYICQYGCLKNHQDLSKPASNSKIVQKVKGLVFLCILKRFLCIWEWWFLQGKKWFWGKNSFLTFVFIIKTYPKNTSH